MAAEILRKEAERRAQKSYRRNELKIGPPKDSQWVWLTLELLESVAWRAMSLTAWRVLNRIIVEHGGHGGGENGKLIVTHRQLHDWGVSKNSIGNAIDELEHLGLIRVRKGRGGTGGRHANLFRLTWIGDHEGGSPTNDWKRITEVDIDAWRKGGREKAGKLRKRTAPKRPAGAVVRKNDSSVGNTTAKAFVHTQDSAPEIISPVPKPGSLAVPKNGSLSGHENGSDQKNREISAASKTPKVWEHSIYLHGGGCVSGACPLREQGFDGVNSDIGLACPLASEGVGVLPGNSFHPDDPIVADCPRLCAQQIRRGVIRDAKQVPPTEEVK